MALTCDRCHEPAPVLVLMPNGENLCIGCVGTKPSVPVPDGYEIDLDDEVWDRKLFG